MLTSDDRAEIRQLIADALQNEDDHLSSLSPAWVNTSASRNGETALDPVINVTARAIEVLGTREKALTWLRSPVRALGNMTPVSLLSSAEGVTQVEDVLGRIEHGLWQVTVYRLHSQRYVAHDGTGAMLYGGRWNRRGIPVIYAAESRALCALEVLVNAGQLADDYVVTAISIPSNLRMESLLIEHLPIGWNSAIPEKATQDVGSQWALSLTSPSLAVPSSIVWRERNYILNPSHSAFRQFEFGPTEPFHFDERLKRMVASSKTK